MLVAGLPEPTCPQCGTGDYLRVISKWWGGGGPDPRSRLPGRENMTRPLSLEAEYFCQKCDKRACTGVPPEWETRPAPALSVLEALDGYYSEPGVYRQVN